MRISDRSTVRNYLKQMNSAKMKYSKTNEQIASGNRFERLSDDVSAGTRVMQTRMDLYQSQQKLDNVKSVNDELKMTENTLMTMQDIITNAHALALKGMNEEKGDSGRNAIANEIKALREQILNLANAQYGKKFVFGGSNVSVSQPFQESDTGKIEYNGIPVDTIQKDANGYYYMDAGDRKSIPMDESVYLDVGLGIKMNATQVEDDTGFLVSISGLDILGYGADASSGFSMNIFNTLVELEDSLTNYNKETLGELTDHLDMLNDTFRSNLTDIGAKTKFLDIMQTRLEDTVDNYEVRIDNLMGIDDAEAATTQAMNDYVLKAVLQMGAKILPVSLMDFLR